MAGSLLITSIRVPADLVRNCPGFSLDIGSSALKIVFRTKEDFEHVQQNKAASHGSLHCITTSGSNVLPALEMVKETGHLTRDDQGKAHVVTCGLGGYENNDLIIDTLDVTIKMLFEFTPMMKAFRYLLEECSTADIVYPYLADVEQTAFVEVKTRWESIKHLSPFDASDDLFTKQPNFPLVDDKSLKQILGEDKLYPCLMFIMGSGFGGVKITRDGLEVLSAEWCSGGRFFMGVGSLLTGCKSYDEFMELAEKGDSKKVDLTGQSMKSLIATRPTKDIQDDNPYKKFLDADSDDEMIFSFGQAMFKDLGDFKKEDVAAAWLLHQVIDVSSSMYGVAKQAGLKHIFVGGSFPNRDLVRTLVTREFTKSRLNMAKRDKNKEAGVIPQLHFLRNSGHLGALGAMIEAAQEK